MAAKASSKSQTAKSKAASKAAAAEASAPEAPAIEAPAVETPVAEKIKIDPNAIPPQQRDDIDVFYFRERLLEEMARLEEERDFVRHAAGDLDGNLPEDAEGEEDTADLAASLMDKEMDMGVEEEIEDTLAAIEHALKKIEDGTYGICDVSGQPIRVARLELLPWASLTAQMQAVAEGEID